MADEWEDVRPESRGTTRRPKESYRVREGTWTWPGGLTPEQQAVLGPPAGTVVEPPPEDPVWTALTEAMADAIRRATTRDEHIRLVRINGFVETLRKRHQP